MRLRWTVPAGDLENIKNYLQQNYPDFAEPTVRNIYQRKRLLKTSPIECLKIQGESCDLSSRGRRGDRGICSFFAPSS